MNLSRTNGLVNSFLHPVLTPLIENRLIVVSLVGLASFQLLTTSLSIHVWSCPLKSVFGIPCPGCGLSTAITFLLHGVWEEAMHIHAFAPVFLVGIIFIGYVAILPMRFRNLLQHFYFYLGMD